MPTFYELFAGVGLVRDALEPLGWTCVYANDIDTTKESIYRRRYPNYAHFERRDIWEVDAAALPRPVDLITASFPCIDLSLAGNRKGLAGEHSGAFWAIMRLLDSFQDDKARPKGLLIENVTGFLSSNDGRDFRAVMQAIAERGYVVDAIEVSAEHFTPQSRPRLFILAARDDLAGGLMASPGDGARYSEALANNTLRSPALLAAIMRAPSWGLMEFPPLPPRTTLLTDVIDQDCDDWWDTDRVARFLDEMSPLHRERLRRLQAAGEQQIATAYRRVRHGRSVYELRADGVAGCLRTSTGGSSKQIVALIDGEDVRVRWMSPLEYARLQGVLSIDELADFKLNDLRTAFGDAVCVPAYRWIAQHAFGLLLGQPRYSQAIRRDKQVTLRQLALLEREPAPA